MIYFSMFLVIMSQIFNTEDLASGFLSGILLWLGIDLLFTKRNIDDLNS